MTFSGASSEPLDADPEAINVLSATYWSKNVSVDVTEIVRALRTEDGHRLSFPVDNGTLGGDPEYGTEKTLTLIYRFRRSGYTLTFKENEQVNLP